MDAEKLEGLADRGRRKAMFVPSVDDICWMAKELLSLRAEVERLGLDVAKGASQCVHLLAANASLRAALAQREMVREADAALYQHYEDWHAREAHNDSFLRKWSLPGGYEAFMACRAARAPQPGGEKAMTLADVTTNQTTISKEAVDKMIEENDAMGQRPWSPPSAAGGGEARQPSEASEALWPTISADPLASVVDAVLADAKQTDEYFAGKRHHYRLNARTMNMLRAARALHDSRAPAAAAARRQGQE